MSEFRLAVLVDDQALFRQGLASLLSLEEDLEIVGQASHGFEAIALKLHFGQRRISQFNILLFSLRPLSWKALIRGNLRSDFPLRPLRFNY